MPSFIAVTGFYGGVFNGSQLCNGCFVVFCEFDDFCAAFGLVVRLHGFEWRVFLERF